MSEILKYPYNWNSIKMSRQSVSILLYTNKILAKILKYLVEQVEGSEYISLGMESWACDPPV